MSLSTIYSKLYSKPNREDLKSHKVELNVKEFTDDLEERKNRIKELLNTTINSISLAQENLNELSEEVMDFDYTKLEDMFDTINTLGIETPDVLDEANKMFQNLEYQTREIGSLKASLNDIESELSQISNNIT